MLDAIVSTARKPFRFGQRRPDTKLDGCQSMSIQRFVRVLAIIGLTLLGGLRGDAEDPGADRLSYVLLNQDFAVLRGFVTEQPTRILIRQSNGEIRLPREAVACWAPEIAGLYQYRLEHRQAATLSEYLKLARWCIDNDYLVGAARELAAARRAAPNDRGVLRAIDDYLIAEHEASRKQRQSDRRDANSQSEAIELASGDANAGSGVVHANANSSEQITASPGVDSEQSSDSWVDESAALHLEMFTGSIQPILNNRCATAACHGSNAKNAFRFQNQLAGARVASPEMTRENLQAVADWIDFDHPNASPLLVRALQAHGDLDAPPLGPRNREAIARLRTWIYEVASASASAALSEAKLAAQPGPDEVPGRPGARSNSMPIRLPQIDDPFDPDIFNRRMHTGRMP